MLAKKRGAASCLTSTTSCLSSYHLSGPSSYQIQDLVEVSIQESQIFQTASKLPAETWKTKSLFSLQPSRDPCPNFKAVIPLNVNSLQTSHGSVNSCLDNKSEPRTGPRSWGALLC